MRISVVITSYNNEKYLAETIESVLAQTLRPHEIIITDDCSQDSSPDIIRHYMQQQPDLVKGLFQPVNLFIPLNRNAALRTVTGDHVTIVDGDDRYLPETLATLSDALRAQPDAGVAFSNVYFIDPDGHRFRIRDRQRRPSGNLFTHIAGLEMGFLRSMLVRYDLMQQVGFLNPDFPHHDGFMLCLELAALTNFAYVFEPIAEYRVHPVSTSKMPHRVKLGFVEEVAAEVLRKSAHLAPGERRYIENRWRWKLLELGALADVQEGHKQRAQLKVVRDMLRPPRHLPQSLALLKRIANA